MKLAVLLTVAFAVTTTTDALFGIKPGFFLNIRRPAPNPKCDLRSRCLGITKITCERNRCCWNSRYAFGLHCYKPKMVAPTLPKSCEESYDDGNRRSGVHKLQDKRGKIYTVYCLYVKGRRGYTFVSTSAVEQVSDLGISSSVSHVLFVQKRSDGSITETKIKQLKSASKLPMKLQLNRYSGYMPPQRIAQYGSKYLYLGFLDIKSYAIRKKQELGFLSNGDEVTYKDCDGRPFSYAAFYPNSRSSKHCESGSTPMFRDFSSSFQTSKYRGIPSNYYFALEINFGNCGFKYASGGCRGVAGFAIGIPFGLREGRCRCSGDPHCYSFDKRKVDFMGTCHYTLVQDGCMDGVSNDEPTFRVIADFHRLAHRSQRVSYTKAAHVDITGYERISLIAKNRVIVGGTEIKHFPSSPMPGVTIRKSYTLVLVELQNGVVISWSAYVRTVAINVPTEMQNEVCGLCGNFNGDPKDDWIMGPGQCKKGGLMEGKTATKRKPFGFSWHAENDNDAGCVNECDDVEEPDPDCPKGKLEAAKKHCQGLWDTNGRFKDCIAKIPKDKLDSIVDDCVFDSCLVGDIDDEAVCAQAESLVRTCKEDYKIEIEQWRDTKFCPLDCPANMVYKSCGAMNQPTCSDPEGNDPECAVCTDGCFCKDGYLSDGDKCILPDDCGCTKDGIRYEIGDTMMTSDCSESCTCQRGKTEMSCRPSGCHEESMCPIVNMQRTCVCPPTHTGDGKTCKPKQGICECHGDPHCKQFDNEWIHFMGSCQYTMVEDKCKGGVSIANKPTFKVVGDFHRRQPESSVSWVKAATVYYYSHENVYVALLEADVVKVNENRIYHFPVNHPSGIIIRKSFNKVQVVLPNNVEIIWQANYGMIRVIVPGTLEGSLCGLCGNFNGHKYDDLIMGDGGREAECPKSAGVIAGKRATSTNQFGVSWLHEQDTDAGCQEECDHIDDPNPECKDSDKRSVDYCSDLRNKNGRFKECLMIMDNADIDTIFNNCVYDSCLTGDEDGVILCSQAEYLVSICKRKYEIDITGWRDEAFCSMDCPDNMVYRDCGSLCQPSCDDPEGSKCGPCHEGCFCKEGFFADGDNCIKKDQCGCVMDGIRYQVGETVIVSDCKKKCTCHQEKGRMECVENSCHAHASCQHIGDESDCVCIPPFAGDGYNCTETTPPNTNYPCNDIPLHCVLRKHPPGRGPCVPQTPNQKCGVGVMTEHRMCYHNATCTGHATPKIQQRMCCLGKCPPSADPQGAPQEPGAVTCADVFPNC